MKRKGKRPLALFLTMAMVFSLTACGSTECHDIYMEREQSPSPEPGTVTPESGKTEEDGTKKAALDLAVGVEGWQQFLEKTFYEALSDEEEGNRIYCPANLYLCLAMLSEVSRGDTRLQITDLLGQENQEAIREQAGNLYKKIYYLEKCRKDKVKCRVGESASDRQGYDEVGHKCILGNSLWLNEGIPFRKEIIDRMEESYFAECSKGKMGTAALDKKIQKWVNEMTGGDLKEQVKSIHTNPNMMIMLLSSIYFEAEWQTKFSNEQIKEGIFYGTTGSDTDEKSPGNGGTHCHFLYQTIGTDVVKTEQYMAAKLPMKDGTGMHIILPEQGVSVEELLEKEKGTDLLAICTGRNKKAEYACVDFSMPKFQIDSEIEMKDVLEAVGVTDMFDENKADFSPLFQEERLFETRTDIYVEKASQVSNMTVNEDGCSVASYTAMSLESKGLMPEKKYKMHCDRPFLFMITDKDDVPLFAGIVRDLSGGKYNKIIID